MARSVAQLAADLGALAIEVEDAAAARLAHGNVTMADHLFTAATHLADGLIELERVIGADVESPASALPR